LHTFINRQGRGVKDLLEKPKLCPSWNKRCQRCQLAGSWRKPGDSRQHQVPDGSWDNTWLTFQHFGNEKRVPSSDSKETFRLPVNPLSHLIDGVLG